MGISLGLVGLGDFGSAFARLFKSHPLVDRIGLCDREPERVARFANDPVFADKFNPNDAYVSLDDICQSDFDALVIITQHWLHAPQAIQAMEHGKHVYSAVPVISIPDSLEILDWCDRIIATTQRTGQHYMLGETTYFHAGTMFCRRKAAAGEFGHFVYSEGEYYHSFDSPECDLRQVLAHREASVAGREWVRVKEAYRARGVQDGPMHYPTHSTSGPMSVMGAHAVKVCCWGTPIYTDDPYFTQQNFPFSNETALFQMSNGATMRIGEHRHCGAGRETFRVYGTEAAYEDNTWNVKGRPAETYSDDAMRDPLPPEVYDAFRRVQGDSDVYGGHGGSHAYLVHEFVDAIAHGRRPAINAWEAARYTAAGAVAHQSALKDGEILPVPDWGDAPA